VNHFGRGFIQSFQSEPLPKATQTIGMKEMVVPITAGILSAFNESISSACFSQGTLSHL
jgi:hypothetical protein